MAFSDPDYENRSWLLDVTLGRVIGAQMVSIHGWSDSISSTYSTIWNDDSINDDLALQSSASVVKISSESANDTSAGTGARSIRIDGLDVTGDPQNENVVMNGQTAVNTTGTYRSVTRATILTAGTSAENEGNIWVGTGTVTTGVPATKHCLMPLGWNISGRPVYQVPNQKVLAVIGYSMSSLETAKTLEWRIATQALSGPRLFPITERLGFNGNLVNSFKGVLPLLPALSLVSLQVKADSGTLASANGILNCIELPDDYDAIVTLYP